MHFPDVFARRAEYNYHPKLGLKAGLAGSAGLADHPTVAQNMWPRAASSLNWMPPEIPHNHVEKNEKIENMYVFSFLHKIS